LVHRRYREIAPGKEALDVFAKRYASGEIKREEFFKMKEEISSALKFRIAEVASKPAPFSNTMLA
jgi:hypothetical protein